MFINYLTAMFQQYNCIGLNGIDKYLRIISKDLKARMYCIFKGTVQHYYERIEENRNSLREIDNPCQGSNQVSYRLKKTVTAAPAYSV
jgi:hypothetical protein